MGILAMICTWPWHESHLASANSPVRATCRAAADVVVDVLLTVYLLKLESSGEVMHQRQDSTFPYMGPLSTH